MPQIPAGLSQRSTPTAARRCECRFPRIPTACARARPSPRSDLQILSCFPSDGVVRSSDRERRSPVSRRISLVFACLVPLVPSEIGQCRFHAAPRASCVCPVHVTRRPGPYSQRFCDACRQVQRPRFRARASIRLRCPTCGRCRQQHCCASSAETSVSQCGMFNQLACCTDPRPLSQQRLSLIACAYLDTRVSRTGPHVHLTRESDAINLEEASQRHCERNGKGRSRGIVCWDRATGNESTSSIGSPGACDSVSMYEHSWRSCCSGVYCSC